MITIILFAAICAGVGYLVGMVHGARAFEKGYKEGREKMRPLVEAAAQLNNAAKALSERKR